MTRKKYLIKYLLIPPLLFSVQAFNSANAGYELICKGARPQSSHKTIQVDCENRKAIIDALGAGWKTLRQQGIGGSAEDNCWKPYKRAKEIHPSVQLNGFAPTFFMECNASLQYAN